MKSPGRKEAAALALALVAPPMFLGGIPFWASIATGVLAWGAFGIWSRGLEKLTLRRQGAQFALVVLLAFAWTLLQSMPLPCGLVAWFHPAAAANTEAASLALNADLHCSISADRSRTAFFALQFLGSIGFFFLGVVVRQRKQADFASQALALGSVAMAVAALLHAGIGAELVFGLYRPVYATPQVMAPLLNNNHLAAFVGFGTILLLGEAIESRGRGTGLWFAAAAMNLGVVLLTLSRGGIAVTAACALCFLALMAFRRRGRVPLLPLAVAAGTVVGGSALGLWTARGAVEAEFATNDLEKLTMITEAAAGIPQAWLSGTGRGAFEAVGPQLLSTSARATHVENLPVQWLLEWGVPIGGALLFALFALVAHGLRPRTPRKLALGVATASLIVHDLFDFATELPALGGILFFCLGVLAGASERTKAPNHFAYSSMRKLIPPAVALVLLTAFALLQARVPLSAQRRLQDALAEGTLVPEEAESAVLNHAGDAAFWLLGAAHVPQEHAGRWLNRAMALAPRWGSPHLLAAGHLFSLGRREQGALELREAAARDWERASQWACNQDLRTSEVLTASPSGEHQFLNMLASCRESAPLDEALLERCPECADATVRQARRLIATDAQQALELVDSIESFEGHAVATHALLALGRHDDAARRARQGWSLFGRPTFLQSQAQAEAGAGDLDAARETLGRLRGLASTSEHLSEIWSLEGRLCEGNGLPGDARTAYQRSLRLRISTEALQGAWRSSVALGDAPQVEAYAARLCELNACPPSGRNP